MRIHPYTCPICGHRLPRAAGRCFFCENPLPLDKGPATSRRIRVAQPTWEQAELPRVYVPARDFGRLETLANIVLPRDAAGELLRRELARAIVCENAALPPVVRIGSKILVRDKGEDGSIQKIHGVLVWPHECHPRLPSIPVSSLLGAAVLGLSAGDVMSYMTAAGVYHVAAVLRVFPWVSGKPATETEQASDRGSDPKDGKVVRLVKKRPNPPLTPSADRDDPPPAA